MTIDPSEGGTSVKESWLCGLQSRRASWVVASQCSLRFQSFRADRGKNIRTLFPTPVKLARPDENTGEPASRLRRNVGRGGF